jgi:hypothetical protein
MMVWVLVEMAIVGYLPGALAFRWPSAGRPARAALPAEERIFWAIILSLTMSCMLVLALAAAGMYTFGRLVGAVMAFSLLLAAAARGDLRLGPSAARVRPPAVVPALLVAVGLWLYFPPAEYVLGGRDPGVYTAEGVQIAQRRSLVTTEALVADVPPHLRGLVFSRGPDDRVRRFMGFFILDASAGAVAGQFPHFYPASLALGYGIDGLTGVRKTTGLWAILGVLAVYFAGTVYFGRPVAAAAAGLLSLHVAQVWFARSPNAEMALQALLFSALLAYARAETTGSRFFAVAAASILGILLFLRVDAFIVLAMVAPAVLLDVAAGRRIRALFVVPLLAWIAAGTAYLVVFVRPYLDQPLGFIQNLTPVHWALIALGFGVMAAVAAMIRRRRGAWLAAWVPMGLVMAVVTAAVYACFFREPGGPLAAHDAYSLRTFAAHYLTPYLLAAALAGYALTVPRMFGPHPLLVVLVTGFCGFFFYKIRIVPEHFWMARRFLPVILPAMLLYASAAVFYTPWRAAGGRTAWLLRARAALGIAMVAAAGWQFFQQTRPILPHVEYAGVVPRLERLAAQIGEDDLVIMESRGSSDLHVLGLPLAYIYARRVLVLTSDRPPAAAFAELVEWAARRYRRVLYLGAHGKELLSRNVGAEFVSGDDFTLPEYDRSRDHPPLGVRQKGFSFGLWRFTLEPRVTDRVRVEVGGADDFVVGGFWAKETNGRFRFRWSTDRAELRLRLPAAQPSELTMWMGHGGRPPGVPGARVSVYVDDQLAGIAEVTASEPRPFAFSIPAGAAARAAHRDGFIVVRLETPTWSPRKSIGSLDERELGVVLTAVELR